MARYRVDRRVSSLLPRMNGARKKRLDHDVEEIIAATLRTQWLRLEAPPLAPVVAEIRARCEEAGLAAPSYLAIASRLRMASRRGLSRVCSGWAAGCGRPASICDLLETSRLGSAFGQALRPKPYRRWR